MDTTRGLPVGCADFPYIRQNNLIYADKTELIYKLVTKKTSKTPYFLSRPRRFGKTLLLSVIKAIFDGRRDLFEGLAIYDKEFDWEPHPVLRFSMDHTMADTPEKLEHYIAMRLQSLAEMEDIKLFGELPSANFERLIEKLNAKYKNGVVVLIDEYDGPILDHLLNKSLADALWMKLKDFYGTLKKCEENLRFIFVTGVSRFVKTSIFSGFNNLRDLTLEEDFANIAGFTTAEFDSLFTSHMEETLKKLKFVKYFREEATVDDLRSRVMDWYDGYSWDGKTRLLNPWSTLYFFVRDKFDNFWFESGAPNFLINMIKAGELNVSDFHDNSFINESMNTM
ncbi:MAG: AAA family ATPase, partial [Deltaproteobacteria bacterium]|nr:AAA family ATPase [Deltaproteobacteria bacterium]